MPDEVQTTAPPPSAEPADPSPAPIEIPTDPKAYADWRKSSGKLPEPKAAKAEENGKPNEEDSAPSSSESSASEAEAKTSQDKQQQQKRKNEGERINEILGDFRAHGLKPSDLKLSREELLERLGVKPQPKEVSEKTAQPAAAPVQAALKEPKEPEFKDYNGDWDKFDADLKKYHRDYAKFVAQEAVQNDRIERAREAQQAAWRQKLVEAKTRYGAEADTAIVKSATRISGDDKIHPAVKEILGESPILTDLLYVMGSEPEDFDAFLTEARERPGIAIRRVVLLEKLVQDELQKGAAAAVEQPRGENGQFVSAAAAAKTPAKRTTVAPAPPTEVSGHGSPPEDEAQRATQTGDFRTFRAIDNRKALARLRGS